MTCLLRVELCAEVFKDVGDEFAGVEQGAYGGFMAMGRLMGFFADFRGFRAPPGCPGVERQFLEPSMVKSSSPSRAPHAN